MRDPVAVYDRWANFYDRYYPPWEKRRQQVAIRELRLKQGAAVLVPGCGTGFDLPLLVDAVGEDGRIVGLDPSGGMLARAQHKVADHGWSNVTLLHDDAHDLSADFLWNRSGLRAVDGLLFSYVLTVMRDWESGFAKAFGLLKHGGRYAVMDLKTTRGPLRLVRRPYERLLKRSGAGDTNRPVIEFLRGYGTDFRVVESVSGLAFVASATKT